MFDSHARNSKGVSVFSNDLAACLVTFPNVHCLYELIRKNISDLPDTGDRRNWYELHPIKVFFPLKNYITREESNIVINEIIPTVRKRICPSFEGNKSK